VVLFTSDAHPGLADGSITVTFRTWSRPQVKAGGRYRVGPVTLEVDALARVPVAGLTEADARRAGSPDLAALRRRLGQPDGADVWRVDFHRVPDADLAPPPVRDRDDVIRRLERMDRAAAGGPWTGEVLRLIAERPGVVSTELATALGRERMAFKADVRKLKMLGLTESLEVGYRLTPFGRKVLRALG
jgi:hypothetical protein